MFLFELSRDPRSAHLFAAYVPVVGLPHGGYNDPPRGLVVSVFVPGVDRSQISLQVFKSENYLEVEVSPSTCDKSVFITQEW